MVPQRDGELHTGRHALVAHSDLKPGPRVGGVRAGAGHDGEDELPGAGWRDRADPGEPLLGSGRGEHGGDHRGGDTVSRTEERMVKAAEWGVRVGQAIDADEKVARLSRVAIVVVTK